MKAIQISETGAPEVLKYVETFRLSGAFSVPLNKAGPRDSLWSIAKREQGDSMSI